MYLCLNKLASKVWKKNCPNFLYALYEDGRKSESSFSHSFLAIFFIHSLKRFAFFKNAYVLMVFVNRVSFMQISDMIPGMLTELEGLGVFWDPSGGFSRRSSLRKFLGSKEHLD